MKVRATYRLQLNRGFTFADAEAVVPYLCSLGISHVYASPVTVAQPGSMHGYDVVDPARINPELGGEEGFRRLAAALKARGMGLILDIVPNHMGIAGDSNSWWQDVLRHGRASRYAHFFDINWAHKPLLPFLATPLPEAIAAGALELKRDEGGLAIWAHGTHRFPLRPEDDGAEDEPLEALLERQHYRLAWWRAANDDLHWRRFFTINELAGVRVEDPEVFEATHALYFGLAAEGLIDGVRIDHVDGLTDPTAYLRRLRERLSDAYIVVEKILAPGERLPDEWPIDGTSGYDFMDEAGALLHEAVGAEPLARLWAEISGHSPDFRDEELAARRDMVAWEFEGQLTACVAAFAALAASAAETEALTAGMLRRALRTLLWVFPAYRTYGTGAGAPASDLPLRQEARARAERLAPPGEMEEVDRILAWLAGGGPGDPELAFEAVRRFQQLSAPVAAKSVEDTAFYRYGRLLSRNEVGSDPALFSLDIKEFHRRMGERAERLPRSMLATATHDHKRGEDARARLAVLSAVADEWAGAVRRWREMNAEAAEGVDPGDEYLLYQTLAGAWPVDSGRAWEWLEKALREAKLRSSWTAPDDAYEARCRAFVERILGSSEFVNDLESFVRRIAPAGESNGLVQAFLRCTAPGVPDLYQGCEFGDFSLVDPDNRRAVDSAARAAALDGGGTGYDAVKQRLIAGLLRARRDDPQLWGEGSWEPVDVEGSGAANVLAFVRRHCDKALVGACVIGLVPGWGDTRLATGQRAADLFAHLPVWWEIREMERAKGIEPQRSPAGRSAKGDQRVRRTKIGMERAKGIEPSS